MTRTHDTAHGIYLHIPFCLRRCHYCDFNTYADRSSLIPRYVTALRADLAAVAAAGPAAVAPAGEGERQRAGGRGSAGEGERQ